MEGIRYQNEVYDAMCHGHHESFVLPLLTSSELRKKAGKYYFNSVMTV